MTTPITLVIADDHFAIWDAVIMWLSNAGSFKVLTQVADGIQALQACVALKPQVLLLDLSMPNLNGLQVIGGLRKTSFQIKTIVYTADDTPETAAECISEGADGYVIKSSPRQILLEAVRRVVKNEIYIDPTISTQVKVYLNNLTTDKAPEHSNLTILTEREIEVIQLLALGSGKSTDIAETLCVSRNTVNNHISSIYRKLEVNTRTEAIRKAKIMGIIKV